MDSQPSPTIEPALSEAFWQVNRTTAAQKVNLSSTLSTISAAASLAAYMNGGDAADPAFITCALVSAAIPLYNTLVMSPTASVVSSKVMDSVPQTERTSWVTSYQRKSYIAAGAAVVAFGCTLLVLGSQGESTTTATANPLRF